MFEKKIGAEGADTFTCNVLAAKNGEIVKIERNLICEVQMLACGRGQVIKIELDIKYSLNSQKMQRSLPNCRRLLSCLKGRERSLLLKAVNCF